MVSAQSCSSSDAYGGGDAPLVLRLTIRENPAIFLKEMHSLLSWAAPLELMEEKEKSHHDEHYPHSQHWNLSSLPMSGYALAMRAVNGSWLADPFAALELLLSHSNSHSPTYRPRTLLEAVEAFRRILEHSPLVRAGDSAGCLSPEGGGYAVLKDVMLLLHSPFKTAYALLDMWMLSCSVSDSLAPSLPAYASLLRESASGYLPRAVR